MLVLDFDGTVTDAETEGVPFRAGYLKDLSVLTGQPEDTIIALADEFQAKVSASPDEYGWMFQGHIVAPACVDPYLRIMPVARMVFDKFGCFPGEDDRSRMLDGILYKYNYQKTHNAFKPGAKEALVSLEGTNTFVVTNSHTDAVQDKIADLGDLEWLRQRVHGLAKKYIVDDSFDLLPREIQLPGLDRPVLLRRKLYFEALERLRKEVGVEWKDVCVAGDIFELDLSLPLAMGARVALVVNQFTPDYERNYLLNHERGHIIEDISEIPSLLK